MQKITTWRPDTCGCEIEYSWDDTQSEDVRTHSAHKINKACEFHSGDKDTHYGVVLDENKRKNLVYKDIIENISTAVTQKEQEDGTMVTVLKKGKEYKWSFDADRNLVVELIGFTKQEKDALKVLTDQKFPGKVSQKQFG